MPTDDNLTAWDDFRYPGDPIRYGVFEHAMPCSLKKAIRRHLKGFRAQYPALAWERWRWQCDTMSCGWRKWLIEHTDLGVVVCGGPGVDYGDNEPDKEVPEANLSGYRTQSDSLVHKHYWLLIGPGRHVFDPTAHQDQFQREWPMRLDGYVVEGLPLTERRRAGCRT